MCATKCCGFLNNSLVEFSILGEIRPDNVDLHVSMSYLFWVRKNHLQLWKSKTSEWERICYITPWKLLFIQKYALGQIFWCLFVRPTWRRTVGTEACVKADHSYDDFDPVPDILWLTTKKLLCHQLRFTSVCDLRPEFPFLRFPFVKCSIIL